jgi:hypothetical protein
MEEEIAPLVTPTPWRWKIWTLRFLAFLLVFVILFIWAMRRSWGEPLPGVRLEPLVKASPKAFRPGSFGAMMNEILKDVQNYKFGPDKQVEINKFSQQLWKDEDFPELTKACEALAPSLKLLTEASNLPESESKMLFSFKFGFGRGQADSFFLLLNVFVSQGRRDLGKGDLSAVLASVQTLARVQSHIVADKYYTGYLYFLSQALPLAKGVAEKVTLDEQFVVLDNILQRFESKKPDIAEAARYDLSYLQELVHAGSYDAPLGRYTLWKWAIGSDSKSVGNNLNVFFSEVIQHLEQNPENLEFEPILTKYLGPPNSMRRRYQFGPDPSSRLWAEHSISQLQEYRVENLRILATSRCLRASLAVRRFQLKNNRLPAALSEALPEPILDPFTDKPLLFMAKPDGPWIVYSVGKNKKDDGGRYNPKNSFNSPDLGIWSNETEQLEKSATKSRVK